MESPPVICFIRLSASRFSASASQAITNRAALEPRHIVRYGPAPFNQEGFGRSGHGIIAQNVAHGLEEGGFSIGTRAIKDEQALLGGFAREGIAYRSLQKVDELLVAVHDAAQELKPPGAGRIRVEVDRCELGDKVLHGMRQEPAGSQINCAIQAVQKPRVRIEQFWP